MKPSVDELILQKIKDSGVELAPENITEVLAITKERMAIKNCSVDEAIPFILKWLDLAI